MDIDSLTVIAVVPISPAVVGSRAELLTVGTFFWVLFLRTRGSNKGRNVGRHAQIIAAQTSATDHI